MKMIARKDMYYGRRLYPGDVFEIKNRDHIRLFSAIGRADKVVDAPAAKPVAAPKAAEPVKAPWTIEEVVHPAAPRAPKQTTHAPAQESKASEYSGRSFSTAHVHVEEAHEDGEPKKRAYKRRDLTVED